ncbi:MAG: Gfo/Idh/MocA family oxidoreductase [Gemmataceae bacterium]|nr:Gfo/Idh/MocA family oxidoreductase [Gemmataceae bacterium]
MANWGICWPTVWTEFITRHWPRTTPKFTLSDAGNLVTYRSTSRILFPGELTVTTSNRRTFIKTSAAASALASVPMFAHAQQNNQTLKVGLIGCGGRGTGAAEQALLADRDVKLWAVGDAFQDQIDTCLQSLRGRQAVAPKLDVPRERQFVGFDAYTQVINSGVDVVLLCTSPHFRPMHLEAAVRANKHVFCEKPFAVDAPGVRRVAALADVARQRRLSVVAGFCWRYYDPMRETVRRIHDGAIGDIQTLHTNYLTGALWDKPRQPGWSDMEWQMRNWPYFTWLSGDYNVEQHCHSLDKMMWVMRNTPPLRAYGVGGRQTRTDARFGHIFDHMAVVYEFANNVRCYAFCRQQAGTHGEVTDQIIGTRGRANLLGVSQAGRDWPPYSISGATNWRLSAAQVRAATGMYHQEHNELFASIRNSTPINDIEWGAKSTMLAILGRMTCYTGQMLTWDQAWNSTEDLSPRDGYRWDRAPEIPTVSRPGVTRFA